MRKMIKFTKLGPVKFIGHLDLLRCFQKAIKQSKLPIAYSQGFNPHQLISFAHPLSLGYSSKGEYIEIVLNEEMHNEEIKESLNNVLPNGLNVILVSDLEDKSTKLMALVSAASYNVKHDIEVSDSLEEKVKSFLNLKEIRILKKTKKKMKEVDLRPGIFEMKVVDENNISLFLSSGSNLNVKPEKVMEAFLKYIDSYYDIDDLNIERNEIFTKKDDKFIPLYKNND